MKGKVVLVASASLISLALLPVFPSGLLQSQLGQIIGDTGASIQDIDFSWDSIKPTKELIWHKCYPKFECARLEVPLDYSNPSGRKAAIALIRKPALVSPQSRFYKGPVLFNPGGPGGSGVEMLRTSGLLFSIVLGPFFDLVSFDPRGVGRSIPRASFFETDAERALYVASRAGLRPVNSTEGSVARLWGSSQILGMLAADRDDGYLIHINTPNTARDMLRIVQAHGEEQLQYWGFSYGTVLGATFATMFPDKVKRMVLDGVDDSEDYYSGEWNTNLLDTDKNFDIFFTDCVQAGPDRCALYSPDPDDIRRNVTSILDKVKREPIPVKTENSYGLIDNALIRLAFFGAFYDPPNRFPALANGIAKLIAGDPIPLFAGITSMTPPRFECSCDGSGPQFDVAQEGFIAIHCNDGAKVSEELSDAEKHFKDLSRHSPWADMWTGTHTSCSKWPNPVRSFQEPFVANTSHPILLVGNTADPVTPLAAAKRMSIGFKDSVVLTQDSPGHCSHAAPSLCTQGHISRYFNHGVLPEPGTVCKIIGNSFPPKMPWTADAELEDLAQSPLHGDGAAADSAFLKAVVRLSELYPVHVPSHFF